MFGLRLKSWMESHLGKRERKSGHQNQKNRVSKDVPDGGGTCSTTGAPTANNIATTTTVTSGGALSSSNGNPHPTESYNPREQDSNLDSSPSSEFSATTCPSSSSVQIQSGSVLGQTAQLQKQEPQTKDYEEKLQEHHQGSTCTRSSTTGSVSNSTSHNILLGSFCNDLSSPDTGYASTDYSPKSVYPALSFESSGKSTPKSSYTISSLVSSELHLSSSKHTTTSLSSASCSVNNGLESDQDHECTSPRLLKTSASLPPHSESDRSNSNLGLGSSNSQDSSAIEKHSNQLLAHSHSITHQSKLCTPAPSGRDGTVGNDTVRSTQCNPTKSSVLVDFSSHQAPGESSMVAAKHSLGNFGSQSRQDKNETCNSDDFSRISFCSNQIQSSPSPSDNNLHNQKRTEATDERKSTITLSDSSEGGSNSSSVLTAPTNRNIRTSFVLVTTATSQIPECNGLKNSFSICSPRKERTRIKTNPWITLNQYTTHPNDGNSNANPESNPVMRENGKSAVGRKTSAAPPMLSESFEKVLPHRNNSTCLYSNSVETPIEINNKVGSGAGAGDKGMDPSNLIYRISTSTSASDSGKGSLEPGTNRNSTESSSCLSDSASTRNSIISHEAELGCSESRSSIGSSDTCSNGHGISLPPLHEISKSNLKINERKTTVSSSTPVKVNKVTVSSSSVIKTTQHPSSSSSVKNKVRHNNYNEQNSEQDETSASLTLPHELSAHNSHVVMVDKETDILSDWANTDDDGEDEIETDRNDDDEEERVTPTPSSPTDTDTGGRVIFHNSQSTGSVTDIDFGDSSAATAASSTGIPTSSSVFRHHYTQNVNKNSVASDPYHHHNIMNPPTTCYQQQGIQIIPSGAPLYNISVQRQKEDNKEEAWNQSEAFGNHRHAPVQPLPPISDVLALTQSGVMCPTGHGLGIPHANISLSSLYSNVSEQADYNANKPQNSSSNAIARGALGFLRKMFKKGSCSSHRTSPGSDKVKMPRSSKSKDSHLDNIASITGLRSSLLTADALVSPHPLVARKHSSINFLTPTPNAFRRRSGTGTDSSGSKSSKHYPKPVKTDIIRLLPGALSPTQQGHTNTTYLPNSSSSTSSSKNTSIGAFCISSHNNTYAPHVNNNQGYSNTNTNSTASSIHSMSTSTSAASTEHHANGQTPRQNQSRLNDNFYPNPTRQSPFSQHQYRQQQNAVTAHSNTVHGKPQPPLLLPPVPPRSPNISQPRNNAAFEHNISSQTSHKQRERDFPGRPPSRTGPCPYDSPGLGVNSPSFNNYSPIHRLVVTGGNHLLNRGTSNSSCNAINCASPRPPPPPPLLHSASPHQISRNGERERFPSTSHHNNNTTTTFTPNINRSVHPSSSPSLINHHQHPFLSSPQPPPHIPSNTFTSPSPILRNPKYQYITSSNQNSPLLNAPRRINVPTPPPNHQQHYYYHNQGRGGGSPFPNQIPNGPPRPLFSTFSPTPPPRQVPQQTNNNPFPTPSPNLNHHPLHSQNSATPHPNGSGGGCEFEMLNSPNLHRGLGNNIPSCSSAANNRNSILNRSQSYQTQQQQAHYYASPVVAQLPPPQSQGHQRMILPHPVAVHPTSLTFNEPPLLMRAHLRNQNLRLNNFLMNKQRHQQSNLTNDDETPRLFPNSDSFQERIYETVDSEEEDDDEVENSNDDEELSLRNQHPNNNGMKEHPQSFYPNTNGFSSANNPNPENCSRTTRLPTAIPNPEAGFLYSNKGNTTQPNSKSKRSKPKAPSSHVESQPPQRPMDIPMALFGPNTFLSETETKLMMEADREADRKYKRLINEAEALLREITAVKSQQPWVHREQERLRAEDCPQSDPLRRKAYDCWALRRLQQELAGCCASPPVLHRSRMNLQSPSTPTGGANSMQPYFIPNLSMAPTQRVNVSLLENNNHNAHF